MPDAPRRYQSRLFNFILQQSLKWTDRAAQTFRHLQVATVWGIQALFYPVYVWVQATRRVFGSGKEEGESGQFSPATELSIPAVDTPILKVLADLERGELDGILDEPVPTLTEPWVGVRWMVAQVSRIGAIVRVGEKAPPLMAISATETLAKTPISRLQIRGIASLMAERKLVLIGEGNQVLDILSCQQQQQLEQRILEEIRHDGMAKPRVREERKLEGKRNRLLGWVQQSPLAMSGKVFQKATRIPVPKSPSFMTATTAPGENPPLPTTPVLQPSPLSSLNPWQQTVSEGWSAVVSSTQMAMEQIQNQVEKVRYLRFPQLSDPWNDSGSDRPLKPDPESSSLFSLEEDRKALPIAPELPRFYYHKIGQIVKSVQDSWQENVELVVERFVQIADPWLSPSIDTETRVQEKRIAKNQPFQNLLTLGDRTFKLLPPSLSVEKSIGQLQTWAKESRNWLAEWGIPGLEPTGEVVSESSWLNPSLTPQELVKIEGECLSNPFVWDSSITEIPTDPQGNWIDTEATSIEYIKHPLEKILEWLDSIAFWLEKRITQCWQFIQRWWQKR